MFPVKEIHLRRPVAEETTGAHAARSKGKTLRKQGFGGKEYSAVFPVLPIELRKGFSA